MKFNAPDRLLMSSKELQYRERTLWAGWVYMTLWGAVLLVVFAALTGQDDAVPPSLRLPLALGLGAFGAMIHFLLGGLTVEVRRRGLKIHLGTVPLVATRIPYEDIESLESVTYSPLREFGGWGLRFRGDKRAWTARGDRAVVLHCGDGKRIYVGSDRPRRLEARIRTAAGDRLAGG